MIGEINPSAEWTDKERLKICSEIGKELLDIDLNNINIGGIRRITQRLLYVSAFPAETLEFMRPLILKGR